MAWIHPSVPRSFSFIFSTRLFYFVFLRSLSLSLSCVCVFYHGEIATTSSAMRAEDTVAVPFAAEKQEASVVDDTAWLLSVASLDERALALQTRSAARDAAADAISRCAAIIKDTDTHIYRRGMAVLALGRTLGRELGNTQAGNLVWMQEFRKVCEA